jgi:hypothetical protein
MEGDHSKLYEWTPEKARKADEKAAFIFVGGKNKKQSMRVFSGTYKNWKKNPPRDTDLMFLFTERIMGTRNDLHRTLSGLGKTQSEVESILKNAVTFNNFETTKKSEVLRELERIKKIKTARTQSSIPLADEKIKELSKMKSSELSLVPVERTSKRSGGTTRRKQSLKEKYDALTNDEVLDVSNMDPETGAGVRKKKWPSKVRGKVHDTRKKLRLITNDADKYARAIEAIFGNTDKYSREIEEVRSMLSHRDSGASAAPSASAASTASAGSRVSKSPYKKTAKSPLQTRINEMQRTTKTPRPTKSPKARRV